RTSLQSYSPPAFAPMTGPRQSIPVYQSVLKRAVITTTIRESCGQGIGAACGLLAGRRETTQ
ncbi:MAG: hypothetical protein KAU31_06665, partial [Spirochaetaceae bacterium]|nr:hypothetical protein [Spirochaetaceae bacterium]